VLIDFIHLIISNITIIPLSYSRRLSLLAVHPQLDLCLAVLNVNKGNLVNLSFVDNCSHVSQ